jgi:hypothetical protein
LRLIPSNEDETNKAAATEAALWAQVEGEFRKFAIFHIGTSSPLIV